MLSSSMEVDSDCRIFAKEDSRMNALQIKHQLYVNEWIRDEKEFRESGMTVKNWRREKHMAVSTFSMPRRAIRQAACETVEELIGDSLPQLLQSGIRKCTHRHDATCQNMVA